MEEKKSPVTQAQLQAACAARKVFSFAELIRSCDEEQLKILDLSNIKMDETFFSFLLEEIIRKNAYAAAKKLIASNKAFDYDEFITDKNVCFLGNYLDSFLEPILPMTSLSQPTIQMLLDVAISYCKADAVRQLLPMAKLNINERDANGKTMLVRKLSQGINLEQVKILVEVCRAKFTQTDIDDYITLGQNTDDLFTHNNYQAIAAYLNNKLQARQTATIGAMTVMGLLKRTPCAVNPKPPKEISQLIGQMIKLKF